MGSHTDNNIRRARWLAYGGLIPFYGLALLAWLDTCREWALQGVAAYAAIIIAFLGAVHWGRALNQFDRGNQFPTLLFGIMPAVLGLVCATFAPGILPAHAGGRLGVCLGHRADGFYRSLARLVPPVATSTHCRRRDRCADWLGAATMVPMF